MLETKVLLAYFLKSGSYFLASLLLPC
jgi:hypothetical protein